MLKEQCIKHEPRQVNNRYKDGKPDIENGKWVLETRCEKCDEKLEVPEYLINKIK